MSRLYTVQSRERLGGWNEPAEGVADRAGEVRTEPRATLSLDVCPDQSVL